MKMYPVLFLLVAILFLPPGISGKEIAKNGGQREDWAIMPAGARPAYMGIHGGTMPVSLLVADDGSNLFSFVGRTGNDFMEVLKNVHMPLPTFGNATWSYGASGDTGLVAGNATSSLPVRSIPRAALSGNLQLQPFGLSDEPLSIEGEVVKPDIFPHARSFRLFFKSDFLRPATKKN